MTFTAHSFLEDLKILEKDADVSFECQTLKWQLFSSLLDEDIMSLHS